MIGFTGIAAMGATRCKDFSKVSAKVIFSSNCNGELTFEKFYLLHHRRHTLLLRKRKTISKVSITSDFQWEIW